MDKHWTQREKPEPAIVDSLCKEINVSRPIATILSQRNIIDYQSAKEFFRPKLQNLHDPFVMKGMEKAVARLNEAICNNEKILVYGDYDVDGTCAVASLYSFVKTLTPHVGFYVPDRYTEGYGISKKGIKLAGKEGYKLFVALDCGIRAIDQINLANSLNIDVIICDHHKPGEKLPAANAILNPKQQDCPYPYKELTGCAIGFKLIQAYALKNNIPEKRVYDFLDFTAVSIACDIVPITGENRILTKYGLELLNTNPRIGFKALLKEAALTKVINVSNLVFGIGPRINAAGRIAHAKQAVELLISQEEKEAIEIAKGVQIHNEERKILDEQITNEALELIQTDSTPSKKTTVLFREDWHKGVIGIVASRCIEKYYRPTIILTESNGKATGSARSIKGFDIHEAIGACDEHLLQFGGHKYAAGLTMEVKNISLFAHKFEDVVSTSIDEKLLIPEIEVDALIELDQISEKFFNVIEQMAPFGPYNRRPVFISKVICEADKMRILKDKHLKMRLRPVNTKFYIDAIAFNFVDFASEINHNTPFYLCYSIEKNEFNGKTSLQLMVKDIKTKISSEEEEAFLQNNIFSANR